MRKIVVTLLSLLWSTFSFAQTIQYQAYPALRPVNVFDWAFVESTYVGSRTRIDVGTGQDPFPFCAAAAAALLWDQHRCTVDGTTCPLATRTSFLAITSVSQELSVTKLNPNAGGAPLLSLGDLVRRGGGVSHAACNYDAIAERRQQYTHVFPNMITYARQWRKYRDYTPYLERMHRRHFVKLASTVNPTRTTAQLESLLLAITEETTIDEMFAKLILNDTCSVADYAPDMRFQIHSVRLEQPFDRQSGYTAITAALSDGRPTLVNFCVNPAAGLQNCLRHSAVIVASARVQHKITGDTRLAYWVVNTWGEDWQRAHSDGWVFADEFLTGMFGEVTTLDFK